MGVKDVETKVWTATAGAAVAGVVLAVLEAVAAQPALLEPLPAWARFVVIAATPTLITFLSGYAAPHTDRPAARA